jgi:hypothetical protein
LHDPVKCALWVGGFCLVITLFCWGYIAWVNSGSRNIALGLGALGGAFVVFILQIIFELKASSTSTDFAIEFVTDYQIKEVHGPQAYNPSMAIAAHNPNLFIEDEASKAIAAASPALSKDDAPRITRDLGVVTIVSYLLDEQSDWQLDTRVLKNSTGTITLWSRVSKPNECTLIPMNTIRRQLKASGNMFADIQIALMGDNASLCLPPHALLEITPNVVRIRSLVCSISFTLQEPFAEIRIADPHAVAIAKLTGQLISTDSPKLPNGSPRYVMVTTGARANVGFGALRAQDRNLSKYQDWAKRVVDGVKGRFEQPG